MASAVRETMVDFVGNQDGGLLRIARTERGQRRQAFALRQRACGIRGRVDEQGARFRRQCRRHGGRIGLEAVGRRRRQRDGAGMDGEHEVAIAGIARIGEEHFVADVAQHLQRQQEGGRRAACRQDAIGREVHAVFPMVEPADGLAQLGVAEAVRVARLALV